MEVLKTFNVNNYLTVKLEKIISYTDIGMCEEVYPRIYVKGKVFNHCISISTYPINPNDYFPLPIELKPIDKIVKFSKILDPYEIENYHISPQEMFWCICSNLQVWAENKYNPQLLHSMVAEPLLKKLAQKGDPVARKIFQENIIEKFKQGHLQLALSLIENNYDLLLEMDQKNLLSLENNPKLNEAIVETLKNASDKLYIDLIFPKPTFSLLQKLATRNDTIARDILKKEISKLMKLDLPRLNDYFDLYADNFNTLINQGYLDDFDLKELEAIGIFELIKKVKSEVFFEKIRWFEYLRKDYDDEKAIEIFNRILRDSPDDTFARSILQSIKG